MQAVEQKPINFQMCRRNNCKPLKPLLKNRNASTGGIKVCQDHLSLCNIILPHSTRTKYAAACLSRWGRQCQRDRAGRTVKMRGIPSVHSRRAQRSSWHTQVISPGAVCSQPHFWTKQEKKEVQLHDDVMLSKVKATSGEAGAGEVRQQGARSWATIPANTQRARQPARLSVTITESLEKRTEIKSNK